MVKVKKPKILILRTAGTNCDKETAFGFELAGGQAEFVHINELVAAKKKLKDYQILALPGGFSYGDDIASGKILANELRFKLGGDLKKFVADGKLIIGICNGFQILVKAGILPAIAEEGTEPIQATLTLNDSAKFEDRWVYLKSAKQRCIWTKDLPEIIYLPVAHGEGKFIPKDKNTLQKLWNNNQIVLQYTDEKGGLTGYPFNPNGSVDNIAGICDTTGRIFGLMPHPERHISWEQHPKRIVKSEGDGLKIFKNAIEYAKNNL